MDTEKLFGFQCDICNETYTKKYSLQRHIQTSHDNYKFTCDICYTQFSRLYSLNNHKKAGKCKLDLGKNPIVSVTPLGPVLPQIPGTSKVDGWLENFSTPPTQTKQGMDIIGEETRPTPGARPPRPTITLPPRKTARAQIRAMASTAIPPTDESWNFRKVFNPGLPLDHAQQHMGDLGSAAMENNTRPLILPEPARETTTSPPWDLLDHLANTESRTTLLANPFSQGSETNLSLMAEAINKAIGDDTDVTMTPCLESGDQTVDLNQDLHLSNSSEADSLSIQEPTRMDPPSASPSDSTLSSWTPTTRVTPRMLKDVDSVTHPPQTLHEGIMRIGADLETLVNLNKKVAPSNQLDVLHQIHNDLMGLMAPYRLYHG